MHGEPRQSVSRRARAATHVHVSYPFHRRTVDLSRQPPLQLMRRKAYPSVTIPSGTYHYRRVI